MKENTIHEAIIVIRDIAVPIGPVNLDESDTRDSLEAIEQKINEAIEQSVEDEVRTRTLYPEIDFDCWLKKVQKDNRPVTERIKTFEDAVRELGEDHQLVIQYKQTEAAFRGYECTADLVAYLKLRIIAAALNESCEPSFTKDEVRWYPWHRLYKHSELDNMPNDEIQKRSIISTDDYKTECCGFGFVHLAREPLSQSAHFGSRICFKSRELALYAGRQFIELYADFNLIRN